MLLENTLKYQELVLYEKEVRFKLSCADKRVFDKCSDIDSFDSLTMSQFRKVVKALWFLDVVNIKTAVKPDHVLVHYYLQDHSYLRTLQAHAKQE